MHIQTNNAIPSMLHFNVVVARIRADRNFNPVHGRSFVIAVAKRTGAPVVAVNGKLDRAMYRQVAAEWRETGKPCLYIVNGLATYTDGVTPLVRTDIRASPTEDEVEILVSSLQEAFRTLKLSCDATFDLTVTA